MPSSKMAQRAIDVCTPKSCANNEDLMSLARQVNAPFQNYSSACSVDILDNQKQPMTYKSWIVVSVIGILMV
uniref:Uncharacterized protein n=1 Tax=Acrobeloides nanus TaxID=290746 RepID=A0A914E7H2_9BILA